MPGLIPVKNQRETDITRLSAWKTAYKGKLGEKGVRVALETAGLCQLAFATLPSSAGDSLPLSVPEEALISATRFGARPAHHPSTAQPAAFAAYLLEQDGLPRDAAHQYLEALLGITLDPWEYRKYRKACEKKSQKAAKATHDRVMQGVTRETLKEGAERMETLAEEFKGEATGNQFMRAQLITVARARLGLFEKIKAGEFDRIPPVVEIRALQRIGRDIALAPGQENTINFLWPLDYVPPLGAYIYSVPAWYPAWTGDPRAFQKGV